MNLFGRRPKREMPDLPLDPVMVARIAMRVPPTLWPNRLRRRMKRFYQQRFSAISGMRTAARARRILLPDLDSPYLADALAPIRAVQQAVHGAHLDGLNAGKFMILNEELDFGGLGAVPWRGKIDPGRTAIRRNLLSHMGFAVPFLARGKPDDFELLHSIVRSLEVQNHWSAWGVLQDVWSAYAASHRVINLLAALIAYREAADEPHDLELEVMAHIRFCIAHISTNLEIEHQFERLMKNYAAIGIYCAGLGEIPRQLSFVRDGVLRALDQTVLADGGHISRSPMHHALALADVEALCAAELFEDHWGEALPAIRGRMRAALAAMTHPDGAIALFNDSWADGAPPSAALGAAPAPDGAVALANTGYVRLGGGSDAVIFDCGECGPPTDLTRAHGDFLSIEASVAGQRLIVDPGVARLDAGPLRALTRSGASHNGPHVLGAESLQSTGAFHVGRHGAAAALNDGALDGLAPLWAAGRQDGYKRAGVEVRRYVGLWPGSAMLVCDLWIGKDAREVQSSFLIHGGWTQDEDETARFTQGGVTIEVRALHGALSPPEPARHWEKIAIEEDAHLIVATPDRDSDNASGLRAAVTWWQWGPDARPPSADDIAALIGRLGEARPGASAGAR